MSGWFLLAVLPLGACTSAAVAPSADAPGISADVACTDPSPWYLDRDGDGFGDPATEVEACGVPVGAVTDATDCDDAHADAHPGGVEVCDDADVDEDCDGLTDDADPDVDVSGMYQWYADADGDGFGDVSVGAVACDAGVGGVPQVADATDCDDTRATVYPGAPERCDGLDTDCDAATGEAGLASFDGADGTPTDLTATLAAGTAAAPVTLALDTPGTLSICAGTWYAGLRVTADVDVVGPDGADVTTLSGGGAVGVVSVVGEALDLALSGLTLRDGRADLPLRGDPAVTAGGGLSCVGSNALEVEDVVVEDNAAVRGGGLLDDGCWLYFWRGGITGNTADAGGGVYVQSGRFEVDRSDVSGNTADVSAGAFAAAPEGTDEAFIVIADTLVSTNAAPVAAAVEIDGETYVQCYGSAEERAGLLSNTSESGGVVVTRGDSLFESLLCDMGLDGTADDNVPSDVTTGLGDYDLEDDARFWCWWDGGCFTDGS